MLSDSNGGGAGVIAYVYRCTVHMFVSKTVLLSVTEIYKSLLHSIDVKHFGP